MSEGRPVVASLPPEPLGAAVWPTSPLRVDIDRATVADAQRRATGQSWPHERPWLPCALGLGFLGVGAWIAHNHAGKDATLWIALGIVQLVRAFESANRDRLRAAAFAGTIAFDVRGVVLAQDSTAGRHVGWSDVAQVNDVGNGFLFLFKKRRPMFVPSALIRDMPGFTRALEKTLVGDYLLIRRLGREPTVFANRRSHRRRHAERT